MSLRRATTFLRRVAIVTMSVALLVVVLSVVEYVFHPFSRYIDQGLAWLSKTEALLTKRAVLGLSLGMLVMTLLVCLFPLLMRSVNKKQYRTATSRGVIAALVMAGTELIYGWAEQFGHLHLITAMAIAIVVTFILIEFLSLMMRRDEEVAFRTDLLASAASGLAAGIVFKLISIVFR